ncbi:hypothetical protein [Arcanobacterium pinnipediorum]|uniref:Shikimate kinase n=1 Tax=Arcanobacterium pinnipediorum TaxID=1503041 RepID=A0ABY5ALR8_9ACTO|nr:hypothetical protein [Arcanobacterium pinnipediorum]USR80189.1 hypothetical protein NG665_04250 [Arcanobacterium pinnipediorum]
MSAVILIGPDGAGKSTILAEYERRGYLIGDVDEIVSHTLGVSVAQSYTDVEKSLRYQVTLDIVRDLFGDIKQEPDNRFALALPPDYVDQHQIVAELRALRSIDGVVVVAIEASVSVLMRRLALHGPRVTNIVLPRKEFTLQLHKRRPQYRQDADFTIDTSEETIEKCYAMLPMA